MADFDLSIGATMTGTATELAPFINAAAELGLAADMVSHDTVRIIGRYGDPSVPFGFRRGGPDTEPAPPVGDDEEEALPAPTLITSRQRAALTSLPKNPRRRVAR